MRIFFVMALAAFIGCTENLEVNNMENEVDISGLKLHYAQKCDGVDVKVYYAPKIEVRYLSEDLLKDFDKYRIRMFPSYRGVAKKIEFLNVKSFKNIAVFRIKNGREINITNPNDAVDVFHTGQDSYVDFLDVRDDTTNFGTYYYSGFLPTKSIEPIEIGDYSIHLDGRDIIKVNGVPCSISIPNIPIEVVPDGSI